MFLFKDRRDAGKKLAEKLGKYKNDKNVMILGNGILIFRKLQMKKLPCF